MFLGFSRFLGVVVVFVFLCACESEIAKEQRLEKERKDKDLITSKLSQKLITLNAQILAYNKVFNRYDDISKMSDIKVLKLQKDKFILDEKYQCFEISILNGLQIKPINQNEPICALSHIKSQKLLNIYK